MEALKLVNYVISIIFFACYFYQFLYIPIPWLLGGGTSPRPQACATATRR